MSAPDSTAVLCRRAASVGKLRSSTTSLFCLVDISVRRTRLSTVSYRAFPVAGPRAWNALPQSVFHSAISLNFQFSTVGRRPISSDVVAAPNVHHLRSARALTFVISYIVTVDFDLLHIKQRLRICWDPNIRPRGVILSNESLQGVQTRWGLEP